jgi:hypothetical protein
LKNWNKIDSGFDNTKAYATYGFENFERYKDFVRNIETDEDILKTFHDKYKLNFFPGSNYGIVYFGGSIAEDKGADLYTIEEPRYYFFRNGVDLHKINSTSDLIKIDPNDPIIKAVKGYFKYKTDTTGSLWNSK